MRHFFLKKKVFLVRVLRFAFDLNNDGYGNPMHSGSFIGGVS